MADLLRVVAAVQHAAPQHGSSGADNDASGVRATCRLLVDEPADGAWNMAVDEALLESAVAGAGPFLRIYAWRRPTLSLGYFQRYADAIEWRHAAGAANVPVVRRPSGGGAILHDRELTYSLVLPRSDRLAKSSRGLYSMVHEGLSAALRQSGIATQLCDRGPALCKHTQQSAEPFLCFLRRGEADLLYEERKACGSAQRRRAGAVLQHGSLILGASAHLPSIRGLDLGETADAIRVTLQNRTSAEIAARLGTALQQDQLSSEQRSRAEALVRTKHDSASWVERR